jgi:hypothetical protein
MMEVFALIIALVALVVAAMAFQRSGGMKDLRDRVEGLGSRTETARERTADILGRLERRIRGKEKTPPDKESEPDESPKPSDLP